MTGILTSLHTVDTWLFYLLNVTLANPVTTFVMPIITNDWGLRVAFGLTMIGCLIWGNARVRWSVLIAALVLTAADQLSSGVLKPLIDRPRPCHILTDINLLVGCGGGKAMPSSHAANAFAIATFFGFTFRRQLLWLLITAGLIAISRVFVGVHYPADITVGAILGLTIGLTFAFLYRKVYPRLVDAWVNRHTHDDNNHTSTR